MLRVSLLVGALFCPWVSPSLLGWVESPGYPRSYPSHSGFNWSRCAPEGHALFIHLIHLDLEDSHHCENDAVKVFSDGNPVAVLCGHVPPEELQSSVNPQLRSSPGGCLNLSFHSDFSNSRRHAGFRGFYTVQDHDECEDPENSCTHFCHNFIGGYYCSCHHGYNLAADNHTCFVNCSQDLSGRTSGLVFSPLWPVPYPKYSRCVFSLSVDPELQLQLSFSQPFDVEQGPDGQCIDSLRIDTHSGTLGTFCGHSPPTSPLLTQSHQVKIHFESDGFGTNRGFSLRFQTQDKTCPAALTAAKLEPQRDVYSRGQEVTVTCDTGHFVRILQKNGKTKVDKEYAATCQSTGEWRPHYPCEPVNCGHPKIHKDDMLVLLGPPKPNTVYKSQIHLNCSSPYYTLKGEDTYTCGPNGDWISSENDVRLPKCIEVCGMSQTASMNVARVIGGKNAMLGQIPWYLLIKVPNRGGASLINDRWAVTAAHVVDHPEFESSLQWYGGLVDGTSTNYVTLQSEKIIIHPNYAKRVSSNLRTNFDNDIALVRFASRVNLGPTISPICLPDNDGGLQENDLGTVAGFGVREKNITARKLKHAPISVYSEQKCQDSPAGQQYTDNMFCAGAEGKDSCEKDSGGPFFVPELRSSARPYRLMGIVSWGAPCYESLYKGYYTKVQNYVPWIQETIEATESSLREQDL